MSKHTLASSLSELAQSLPESDILYLIQRAVELKKGGITYDKARRSEAAKKAWVTKKNRQRNKVASG